VRSALSRSMSTVKVIAAWLLALAACGAPSEVPESQRAALEPSPVRASDCADADGVSALVDAMTCLGIGAFGQVAEPANNLVLSPASIAMAFGMARAGAEGATAQEIDTVFGFPSESAATDAAFKALDRLLDEAAPAELESPDPDATRPAGTESEPPALEIANGAFPQVGFPIKKKYLATLAAYYDGRVIPVDFTAPDRAKKIIDDWVSKRTRGRIGRLFDRIDPAFRLILANAVYLKADWLRPFAREPTEDLPFTLADGSEITVPTMQQLDTMRYAQGGGWLAESCRTPVSGWRCGFSCPPRAEPRWTC
jgi:serine protease inhibitor